MILGLIPARGGSKGIPRKNLRPLLGKPLIAWSIEAAKAARRLDRFVISTEDPEIAAVARAHGGTVLDRPAALAADRTDTLEVMRHALQAIPAEVLVLLQPTSPVRDPGLIDRCVERFLTTGADSLATGFQCTYTEYGRCDLRRQEIPGFFYDDGNIYVMRADRVLAGDRYGKKIERFFTGRELNVDIDEEFDFWLAEQVLKKRASPPMERP